MFFYLEDCILLLLEHAKLLIFIDILNSMENVSGVCPKCNGKKRIMRKDGTIQPCWDCLSSGEMDQHDKNPKDSGLKV